MTGRESPAGLLHEVLVKARHQAEMDESAVVGWAHVFGMEPGDIGVGAGSFLRSMVAVMDLAAQVRASVSALPEEEDPELLLEHFHEVESALGDLTMLSDRTAMSEFLRGVSPLAMYGLRLCDGALRRQFGTGSLPPDEVERITRSLQDLLDQVRQARELDPPLRVWLVERLEDLLAAVNSYVVSLGAVTEVERSLDTLVGGLRRHPERLRRLRESPVLKGLVAVIVALDLALNLAANLQAITGTADVPASPVVIEIMQESDGALTLPAHDDGVASERAS